MDAFYEKTLLGASEKLKQMRIINGVIDEIRAINFGTDEAKKRGYKRILFLATDDNAEQWVSRALKDLDENPLLAEANDLNMSTINKMLFVKSYRELCNKKRKAGEVLSKAGAVLSVTPDELAAQFLKDFDNPAEVSLR